jgi:hypothetical protein
MARTFKFVARRRIARRALFGLLVIVATGGHMPVWGDAVDSSEQTAWKTRKSGVQASAVADATPQRSAQEATTNSLRWRNRDDKEDSPAVAEKPENSESPATTANAAVATESNRTVNPSRSSSRPSAAGFKSSSRRVVRPQPVTQAAWFEEEAPPAAKRATALEAQAIVEVQPTAAANEAKSSLKIIDAEIVDYTAERTRPTNAYPVRQAQAYEQSPASRRISDRETRTRTRFDVLNVADESRDPFREDPFDSRAETTKRGSRPDDTILDQSNPPEPVPPPSPSDRFRSPRPGPSGDDMAPNEEPNPLPDESPDMRSPEGLPAPSEQGQPSACGKEKGECVDALDRLKNNTIDHISLDIRVSGAEGSDFPCECTLGNEKFAWRKWSPICYTWKANGQCHKPLYFEDVQLERYGHAWNPILQPFLSAGHFYSNVLLLPYHMAIWAPNECIYTLGYYRPGSCAPYVIEPFPLSLKGALFESSAIFTGAWVFGYFAP